MIVHALQTGGDDVEKMIGALEGHSFDSVKGKLTVRAEDHALLQPMFRAKMSGDLSATLAGTVTAEEAAPPAAAMKG
jgi:branched-chain amino acid transport system substrate-binding protein